MHIIKRVFLIMAIMAGVGVATSASETPNVRCIQIVDTVLSETIRHQFADFYDQSFSPQNFETLDSLSNLEIFDCGYMYIIETIPKQGVFGASTAFIFNKRRFGFSGSLLIEPSEKQ